MRLFVGVELPGDVKDALAGFIEGVHGSAKDAKWVPRDNLHLTLAFLGEVDEERVPALLEALAAAAMSQTGPIATALEGTGAFPSARRARVLWVGLSDAEGHLAAVAEAVSSALEPLGFRKEKRAWTAHVTLARFRIPGDATGLLSSGLEPVAFMVPAITLFRSRLARPAPRYEIVARQRLGS